MQIYENQGSRKRERPRRVGVGAREMAGRAGHDGRKSPPVEPGVTVESDLDVFQEIYNAFNVEGDDGFLAFLGFQEGKVVGVVVIESF